MKKLLLLSSLVAAAIALFYGATNGVLFLLQVSAVPRILVTRSLTTTAAIHPVMAGDQALQLREDPAAADMGVGERALRANVVAGRCGTGPNAAGGSR